MIENFENVKNQLKELSDVINSFNSEAVQLRIIDLIFNITQNEETNIEQNQNLEIDTNKPKRKRSKLKPKVSTANGDGNKKKPAPSGQGPTSTLAKLAEGQFFDNPQSIKSIIEHCEVNLARKIKQTDISGKLARMVRDGTLKRAKNADGQYEYSKQ